MFSFVGFDWAFSKGCICMYVYVYLYVYVCVVMFWTMKSCAAGGRYPMTMKVLYCSRLCMCV